MRPSETFAQVETSAQAAWTSALDKIEVAGGTAAEQTTFYSALYHAEQFPSVTQSTEAVDVYTTLDLHLQRFAQEAVSNGIAKVDQLLSRRKRPRVPQAALIAVDPRTGDVFSDLAPFYELRHGATIALSP